MNNEETNESIKADSSTEENQMPLNGSIGENTREEVAKTDGMGTTSEPRHETDTEELINDLKENKGEEPISDLSETIVEPLFEVETKEKTSVGRPTVMTPEVIARLEYAFVMGCTDSEACLYAGISHPPLYEYQQAHPEFTERKNQLKQAPFLKARTTIVESLSNPEHAKWYMERKLKAEFAARTEITGKDGESLNVSIVKYADDNTPVQVPAETLPTPDSQSV